MDTTTLHPLHALYLRQHHGEVATLARRAQLAQAPATAAPEPAPADHAAALIIGLGLAVTAAAVAHLTGKRTRGK